MERRFIDAEIRASSDGMIVEGYPIVYEQETNLGYCRETIARGAATEALKNSDEIVLFNHDSNIPLARRKNGTLEVREDDHGVFIRADFSKSSAGPDVYADIKNGLIDKMSFAFTCDVDEWDDDLRTVRKFKKLYDYSPVTYPAYKQTEIVARNAKEATRTRPEAPAGDTDTSAEEVRETTTKNKNSEDIIMSENITERLSANESRMNELEGYLKDLRIDTIEVPDNPKRNMSEDNDMYALRSDGSKAKIYRSEDKWKIPDPNIDGIRADELSMGRLLRGYITGDFRGAEAEERVLSSRPGSGGGLLVPETLSAKLIEESRAKTRCIKAGALTVPMESQTEKFVKIVNQPTPYWVSEGTSITASDMTFEGLTYQARTLAALIRVPLEVIRDGKNIDQIINNAMTDACSRALDYACLSGTGEGMPLGITASDDIAHTTVSGVAANAVMSTLVDGVYNLIDNNIDASEVSMLYNSTFGKKFSLAVSPGSGDYFGSVSMPDVVSAMRKFSTNQLEDSSSVSPVVLGRFSDYMIGIRSDMEIDATQYDGDSFAQKLVSIRILMRADAMPTLDSSFHVLDIS